MSKAIEGWDSCPQGELTRLATDLAFRRRVKAALTAGIILLAGAGVAGGAWLAHDALSSPAPTAPCAPCSDAPATCDTGAAQP